MPAARRVRLYLAGPEVFAPDGPDRVELMREACRDRGLEPISPLDAGEDEAASIAEAASPARRIFDNNIAMIRRADALVANMTHFRGPDPDAGTAFEVGYAFALGKRCYVYSDDGATAVARTKSYYGPVSYREDGTPIDRDGFTIENFGGPFNLMLTESSTVVTGDFVDAFDRVAADVAAGLFAV